MQESACRIGRTMQKETPGPTRALHCDTDLVRRAAAGDMEAFAGLVGRHQARVYGRALQLLGNRADADDAAQDAFFLAYRSLDKVRDAERFGSYVTTIVARVCLRTLGKRGRTAPLPSADTSDIAAGTANSADPAYETETRELRECVTAALSSLPRPYADALRLRLIAGMKAREIAVALDLSVKAVETRLSRGKEMLRRRLTADYPGLVPP